MKKTKTIFVSCNLCGAKNYRKLFDNFDRQHQNPGIFGIVKCRRCGLVYLNPRPKNIADYYPSDYKPYNISQKDPYQSLPARLMGLYYRPKKSVWAKLASLFYEWVYHPIPKEYKGKILDLGCGRGTSLFNLKKQGWKPYGLDVSKRAVKFANQKLGLGNVVVGTLRSKKYPDNYFDVVSLKHVIEHLPDPYRTLKEIKRILRPGGLLLIITPNFSSLPAIIFKSLWFPVETPRHFYLFTPSTLKELFTSAGGFKIIRTRYSFDAYSLEKSLEYFLGNKENINQVLRKLKVFLLPLTFFLGAIKMSDISTFYVENQKLP